MMQIVQCERWLFNEQVAAHHIPGHSAQSFMGNDGHGMDVSLLLTSNTFFIHEKKKRLQNLLFYEKQIIFAKNM